MQSTASPIDEGSIDHRRMIDDLLDELRVRGEGEVRLVETHISWVLLGAEVYKIKKPVALPFLDFSALEKRKAACRTEVRINRPLAPRTYLGVVPIRRTPDGRSTFGPTGTVVEWAVRMRRLDDRRRADVLLERGRLTGELIDRLALGIASFHADAAAGPRVARHGRLLAIERNVSENFGALSSLASTLVSPAEALEAERSARSFLHDHRDLFESRIASGAVRDGHGDLRLEHVFFTEDDDFEVIDGVEFSERYRCADVCADVAFLAMDIARLGRVDLAERFLAMYARAANDFEMYRLVDFYESYRACVRAKIAVIGMEDQSSPYEVREKAASDARRYLRLAVSVGRQSLLGPVLVAVAGGIASGKSTLADYLGRELSAPVVDADRTRKFMLGLAPTTHADVASWSGPYDPRFSEQVYAEVLRRVDAVLSSGRPVVVDASFRTVAARSAARDLARAHGVPFRLFECVAPPDVCRARVARRDRATSVSDGRVDVFDAFLAGFEPITELPAMECSRVDTSGSVDAACARAKGELTTWPRRLVS